MKLIKKIAAIMFAFMMVVSMSCNVKADEGTTATTEKGTITINNAIPEQTYTIYKILDLESYRTNVVEGEEKGNFAYKPSSEWVNFIKGENVKDKYFTFEGEYVSWKEKADPAEFAKLALDYAKNNTSTIHTSGEDKAVNGKVQFTNLSLGYYLVDSSVGSLCGLDTTAKDVTIQEKNGVPSVEKKVYNGIDYVDSNNANIGDTISFQTTINVKKGATNYILHDKMSKGLTYDKSANITVHAFGLDEVMWAQASQPKLDVDYEIKKDNLGDDCSFHIEFKNSYLEKHADEEYVIHIAYNAILNENAVIAGEGNKNKTWLKYGDSQSTQPVTTNTKTFEMNVFKFYEDKNNSNAEKGLADATFKLTKDSQDAVNIGFVKTSNETATDDVYRVAKRGETGTVATITSPKSGKFTIQGLGAGTYYLTETKQPDGYNKLSGPVTVVIDKDGQVKVKNGDAYDEVTQVKVENKSGTVLPSTGGAGTTMIYLVGAVLVLGSGVVLATKRRVKDK